MKGPTPVPGERAARHRGVRRWLLFGLGWIFFGLGVAGAVLPVLPTTPFMLLALWAFSSSSERFHAWLFHHRVFGPPLQRWSEGRVISPRVKAFALAANAGSFAWIAFGIRPPLWALAAMFPIFAWGAWYVARLPTRAPAARVRATTEDPE